jgi:nitrogen fixation/metabolism regulation signal transduction histidine kinase
MADAPHTDGDSRLSLRKRILGFVGALVLLSLLASTVSVYRITEVNRLLDAINRVSVPLGRLFSQMQSDADVLKRELERSLGYSHWKDPHWRPRPIPRWIEDILENETGRLNEFLRSEREWASPEDRTRWLDWAVGVEKGLVQLRTDAARLYTALDQKDDAAAEKIYPLWISSVENWQRQIQWGAQEYERALRQTFSLAENRVAELRMGLEMILGTVVLISLLFLWIGERALRPLAELTQLARSITRRGLRREDKALLPSIPLSRTDEVSQLAREFHRMATALLEREKTVDNQKNRLVEQNKLLREIGELNSNILNSIDSVLIVTDLQGRITQCNPVAESFLGEKADRILGSSVLVWPKLGFVPLERLLTSPETLRIEPRSLQEFGDKRVYGGYVMPLRHAEAPAGGAILVLDDLTEDLNLQERLRIAENLAAIGRMSAQVAHEVRNPLHSIGLEAELASELAQKLGHLALKQSLQSILSGVDRLEKITENYLKLSRLSAGEKREVDLGLVLESVLATYAPVFEAQKIQVDWRREQGDVPLLVWGDPDLLEQVLGNLLRNAIQVLEQMPPEAREVAWAMGFTETNRVWITIVDSGPGVPEEIKSRLFTPFVTTRAQGTGLGLSFVKKVIEDHGGQVKYVERHGRPGACFEMSLPAVSAVSVEAQQPTGRASGPGGEAARIMEVILNG